MSRRKQQLTKKIRFEVFKRDSFTCQYCGAKAPDVLLQADHIDPVSKGGHNEIINLITSCVDCNIGKGNRLLSDSSVVQKQHAQLAAIQERREQINMLFEWKKELMDIDNYTVDMLSDLWSNLLDKTCSVSDHGKSTLKALLRKFSVEEIMSAMDIAAKKYYHNQNCCDFKQAEKAFLKIGGICATTKASEKNPNIVKIYYIRAVLRNRLSYCDDKKVIQYLHYVISKNLATIEQMENLAKEVTRWTEWRDTMLEIIQGGSQ